MNVFEKGDTPEMLELLSSLMLSEGEAADNEIWVQYANEFLEAFIPAMIWKREKENLKLDASSLWDQMSFENTIDLSNSIKISSEIQNKIKAYLNALHSFSKIEEFKENDQNFMVAKQQHGYRTMQLIKPLGYLSLN